MKPFIAVFILFLMIEYTLAQTENKRDSVPIKSFVCGSDIYQMDLVFKE